MAPACSPRHSQWNNSRHQSATIEVHKSEGSAAPRLLSEAACYCYSERNVTVLLLLQETNDNTTRHNRRDIVRMSRFLVSHRLAGRPEKEASRESLKKIAARLSADADIRSDYQPT